MQKLKYNKFGRRHFLKRTAIGAGGAILAPTILPSCVSGTSANSRVLLGHIGVGGQGGTELHYYFLPLDASRSVAICDVRQERRDGGVKHVTEYYNEHGFTAPECKPYLDFEEVLQRDDIDAVHITTPDHWHVPSAIKAARAGKHIMVAKPLGLSYPNYKILKEELIKNDVRFHYGTQQRAQGHMQLGISMIKEGKIGDIEKVEVWAPGKNPDVESPACNEVPVPDGFDFDRWTGPAPLNSYCPERVTNNGSFFQYDYSIGFLGGWGAHPLDVLVWALADKVDGMYSCEGTGKFWAPGGIYDNILSWDLDYEYESGIKLRFVSTDVATEKDLLHYRRNKEANGTTFYGTKGWISLSRFSTQSNIPELDQKLNDFPKGEKGMYYDYGGAMGQLFVDVVTGKIKETNPLDEAIMSDTISHMGDITIRTNRKITWDPVKGEVVGDPEANRLYIREMREPYTV